MIFRVGESSQPSSDSVARLMVRIRRLTFTMRARAALARVPLDCAVGHDATHRREYETAILDAPSHLRVRMLTTLHGTFCLLHILMLRSGY